MNKKQKKTLQRIIIAAILTVALALLFHFVALPWFVQLILWLVPYLVIGHDVLRKAFMGIKNGEVFDENFLMAIATVGAVACGEYSEGVAVMLFYQIGELFQAYAVGKSPQQHHRPDGHPPRERQPGGRREQRSDVVDPDDVADRLHHRGQTRREDPPGRQGRLAAQSTLNTAALTGESLPPHRAPRRRRHQRLRQPEEGILRIETTTLYDDSTVAKILDLVENSSLKKARHRELHHQVCPATTPRPSASARWCWPSAAAAVPGQLAGLDHARPDLPGHQLPLRAGHLHPPELLRRHRRRV